MEAMTRPTQGQGVQTQPSGHNLTRKLSSAATTGFALAIFPVLFYIGGTLLRRSLKFTGIPYLSVTQLPNHFWLKAGGSLAIAFTGVRVSNSIHEWASRESHQKSSNPSDPAYDADGWNDAPVIEDLTFSSQGGSSGEESSTQ